MKERPILFNGAMVRALLDGTKTQTRRVVKPQPSASSDSAILGPDSVWRFSHPTLRGPVSHATDDVRCPYGQPGDRLWVRETWTHPLHHSHPIALYRATDESAALAHLDFDRWIPSIHMPRWASRITLEVTDVRVERLNDCSEMDAMAEGMPFNASAVGTPTPGARPGPSAIAAYRGLWESINGAGSWELNPWVWVLGFKRLKRRS